MSDPVIEAMDRVVEEDLTHPPHTVDARRVLRAALQGRIQRSSVFALRIAADELEEGGFQELVVELRALSDTLDNLLQASAYVDN